MVGSYTDYTEGKIFLANGREKDATQLLFMYEVILACIEQGGLLNRIQNEELQDEESIVRDLTSILYSVITENPKIFPPVPVPIDQEIKVGPRVYTVTANPFLHTHDGELLYGQAASYEGKIELLDSMSEKKKPIVFLHELLHVIMSLSGLSARTSDYTEQLLPPGAIAHGIATYYIMILQDNEVFRGNASAS